jgi:alpha-galactosidase
MIKKFFHNNMTMEFIDDGKSLNQKSVNTEDFSADNLIVDSFPNYSVAIMGANFGGISATTRGYSNFTNEFEYQSTIQNENEIINIYKNPHKNLLLEVIMEKIKGCNVIKQYSKITNMGEEDIIICQITSAIIQGIALDGVRRWDDKNKIKIHYCIQAWQGEGQWRSADLEELGIFRTSVNNNFTAFHLNSIGSFSTSRFYPLIFVEDMETGKIWYMQAEASTSWHMEIGYRCKNNNAEGGIFISADTADDRFNGFYYNLKPGQTYETSKAAYGCCEGGISEALLHLNHYKRSKIRILPNDHGIYPIVFNDYMNCIWGNPTAQKELPLIDAAAKAGAEYFCIDAGWFSELEDWEWGKYLGEWQSSKKKFGSQGLQGIIDYIKSKGMKPGIWLEMEMCGEETTFLKESDESCFLIRQGTRVGGGHRHFLNYRSDKVCNYIEKQIAELYKMGIRFIKNDYNDCIGLGDESLGNSAAYGMWEHIKAFYLFIDKIRNKYNDLLIENCASGALRCDSEILSHFHMQSSSDQEIYTNYPSIILGTLGYTLPEHAGFWAYPYPKRIIQMRLDEREFAKIIVKEMIDGEQTIFNMINGMCGNLYLSGCIQYTDELNMSLIKEAIELYKRERNYIHTSSPVFPLGFINFNNKNAFAVLGLTNKKQDRILIYVWRLSSCENCVTIPINSFKGYEAKINQIYPEHGFETSISYSKHKAQFTVRIDKQNSARLFEIVKKCN